MYFILSASFVSIKLELHNLFKKHVVEYNYTCTKSNSMITVLRL